MKLTHSMRQCLIQLHRAGEGIRYWHGTRGDEWSWRINDASMTQQVDRCIRARLIDVASRDRVVLSDLGQRVLGTVATPRASSRSRRALGGYRA